MSRSVHVEKFAEYVALRHEGMTPQTAREKMWGLVRRKEAEIGEKKRKGLPPFDTL